MDYKKIALVSGGTRGIGKHTCFELAKRGFKVIFTYKQREGLAFQNAQEIEEEGYITPSAIQCDMTEIEAVRMLAKQLKKEYGKIDVLVNNAGILGSSKPFIMTKNEDWWQVLNTNISCVINCCRAILPLMISKRKGTIVNVTSLSGQRGNPGQSSYAASKAAIVAFSKSLHKEIGSFGIRINCVSPGLIETDMTKGLNPKYFKLRLDNSPLKRMGKPEEVANLIGFIADEAPDYMLGQEITIDGGIGV